MIELLAISKIVLFTALVLALVYSIRLNIKLGVYLLKVEDSIEESLDILDNQYKSISEILKIPIFFDSTEVRQVISDIEIARNSVLKVANVLTSVSEREYVSEELDS